MHAIYVTPRASSSAEAVSSSMTATARPRAVLYVRLSRDTVASTSIAGQTDDLSVIADRAGWDVVATFTDNGKSGGKERANAQAAYDLWARGDADILAVYAYDRWSRMGIKTLAALIEVVDARARTARPAVFMAVREGIESTQPDWQLRAAFAADMAKRERDLVSSRQTAARKRLRAQGRNAGHGLPPFGYRTGPHPSLAVGRGLHVIPHEAAIIREVADRIIAGESLTRLGRELEERGVATSRSEARRAWLAADQIERGETPSAKEAALLDRDPATLTLGSWSSSRVRDVWTRDYLLGRITHNDAPVYGDDGAPLAPFEPILDLDTLLAVRARFETNGKANPQRRRAAALLSGVAYCSGCDRVLYRCLSGWKDRPYDTYSCRSGGSGPKCPRPVTISARKLEAAVVSRWLAVMGRFPEHVLEERFVDREVSAQLADVEARLAELGARLVAADDEDEAETLTASLAPLKARRKALREVAPTHVARMVPTGRTYAEAWEAAEADDARRALLRMALDHVVVRPADTPDRVLFHWEESVGEGYGRRAQHSPSGIPSAMSEP